MASANLLFRHDFDGAGCPAFDVVRPDFSFEAAGDANANGRPRSVVDGMGHGLPSRTIGGAPGVRRAPPPRGRRAHRTALWAIRKNAGFAGRREVGILGYGVR